MTGEAGNLSRTIAALARGPGMLAAAGVTVNIANLAVNVLLGRILLGGEFGQSVALVNVFLVASIPGTALQVAVVRRAGSAVRDPSTPPLDLTRLRRLLWLMAGAIGTLGIALASPTADLLSVDSPVGVELVALSVGCWLSLSVSRGLLQSQASYPPLALNLMLEGGLRVAISVIAGLAGMGAGSLPLGLLTSVVIADVLARRGLQPSGAGAPKNPPAGSAGLLAEARTAFAALAPLAVLQNFDVVLVGLLAPYQVGPYAAVATTAKVPVFLGLAVGNYLLAEAASNTGTRRAAGALLASCACVVAPAAVLLAVAGAASKSVLSLVYGAKLSSASAALAPLTCAMTCLALSMLASFYLLGRGRRVVVPALVAAACVTPPLVALGHGQPVATAWWMLGCQGLLAAVMAALVLVERPGAAAPA